MASHDVCCASGQLPVPIANLAKLKKLCLHGNDQISGALHHVVASSWCFVCDFTDNTAGECAQMVISADGDIDKVRQTRAWTSMIKRQDMQRTLPRTAEEVEDKGEQQDKAKGQELTRTQADDVQETRTPEMGYEMIRGHLLDLLESSAVSGTSSSKVMLAQGWRLFHLSYLQKSAKLTAPANNSIVQLGYLYLNLNKNDIRDLEDLLNGRLRHCDSSPRHERFSGLDPTSGEYLSFLLKMCANVKSRFDAFLTRISEVCCYCEPKLAVLKSKQRCIDKAHTSYNNDYSRVLDIIRGSFICSDVKDVIKVVHQLLDTVNADPQAWQVLRYKNRFAPSYDATSSRGYRDLNVNIRHLPTGVVAEVQFHIRSLFEYDKQVGGHKTYGQIRCVDVADAYYVSTLTFVSIERFMKE
jgi:hypothetical protein